MTRPVALTRPVRMVSAVATWITVLSAQPAHAQPAPRPPEALNARLLAVSPAPAPIPALKYRLLPSVADLNPGDAAPVYLRLRCFDGDKALEEAWSQISEKTAKWKDIPLDRFPTAEARMFVDLWKRQLKQIEFGAHRRSCDWNYTLDEQRLDRVNIALSDAQSMRRQWGRLLVIKVRVELSERKYGDAIHTLETGLAFARHVAEGPFLINGLLGVSIAHIMFEQFEELISLPGAPNLYWALTALPRPLIDVRSELEIERRLFENLIPELTEAGLDQSHTQVEWASLLARIHGRVVEWSRIAADDEKADPALKALSRWDLGRFKAESLTPAREYLKNAQQLAGPRIAAMSDDEVVAVYLAGRFNELWDDLFKASYLPPREARSHLEATVERIQAARKGPIVLFVAMIPSIATVVTAQLRLDRQIAALRVVEALRIYAAAHGGKLPETLDQLTDVPVPDDPATGEQFIYRAADGAAILHALRAGLPLSPTYRITIRR